MRVTLARLRRRLKQATSPARLSAAFVLVMAVDFATFQWGMLHLPFTALQGVLFAVALANGLRRDRTNRGDQAVRRYLYHGVVSLVALIALEEKWWIASQTELASRIDYAASYRIQGAVVTTCGIAAALGRGRRFARFFAAFAEHPARQMAISFVMLAAFGGFLLTLPACVRDPSAVSFLNALFMATSAVCVTGFTLHNVAEMYTPLGQGVLLSLVQAGGLGIMVLSASLAVLAGRKLRAKSSAVLAEILDSDSVSSLRGSILRILMFTVVIEAVGALALYLAFQSHPELALPISSEHPKAGSGDLLWAAVFHAVSAFCNAGFTLTRTGLEPFVGSPGVCAIVMVLVILGGLGFPVLSELWGWVVQRARGVRPPRFTLHTRVVLLFSLVLSLSVAVILAGLEWQHAFKHLTWPERALAALFQSVTLRTAGFHTVNFATLTPAALGVCSLIMFVGASPGGTGGGIKVTTFAVLFAAFRAELRGGAEPHLLDRRISEATVRRAIAVAFVAALVLTFVILLLLVSERGEPFQIVFEAVGAISTAGISTGLTPSLSPFGKLLMSFTMLMGRVGPLTLAIAATQRAHRYHYHRAQERVLIG